MHRYDVKSMSKDDMKAEAKILRDLGLHTQADELAREWYHENVHRKDDK